MFVNRKFLINSCVNGFAIYKPLYRFSIKVIVLALILCLLLPVVSFGADDGFVWSGDDITSLVSTEANESSSLLNLECGGAVLIEQNTGKVLYDHHMHDKLRPASVTKVMTILLIMEALDSRPNYFGYENSL